MAPFRSRISKISSKLIGDAEDLHIVMAMYNLLECSQSYAMTSGNFWNYYRNETSDYDGNVSDGKSFKYKTKIVWKTLERPKRPERPPQPTPNPDRSQPPRPPRPPQPPVWALNAEVTIPVKYRSNFWRISWFEINKLWNRTWFIMDKRLCIDRASR